MAVSTDISPFLSYIEDGLRTIDFDGLMQSLLVQNLVKEIDTMTSGALTLVVVGIILLVDLFTKSSGRGGKSFSAIAAHAWQENRNQSLFNATEPNGRSPDPVTDVLDILADAVLKWEEPLENAT
ncbi:uncharacterized protein LOC135220205 [Macrobrachium nipponense]|uniref:uncharacterized protein LOC135220205 n=1 Tax=Macrobrachium nipponense TaxID=159736 RepID=UPI0030C7C6F9